MGTLLDRIHVNTLVLAYKQPGQPYWVPPLFGGSAIVLGQLSALMFVQTEPIQIRQFVINGTWFIAIFLITSRRGWRRALLMFALLTLRHKMSSAMERYSVLCAIIGCLVESTLVKLGLFQYMHPCKNGNIPNWLPFLYLHAAPFLADLHQLFHQ